MRLITFLGIGNHAETTYVWTDSRGRKHAYTTPYAPAASARALAASEVAVLVTAEAYAKHGAALAQALEGVAPLRWVDIPSGANEPEMWEIYGAMGGCVAPGEEIALDVTHGFRSLPLMVLLAAAFLRVARQVQIRHILYGAYEARDTSCSPSRSPVFDLAPMFALVEWANAADRLARQGDARDLAELLRRESPPYQEQRGNLELKNLGRQLGVLAKSLDQVSTNLMLSRPHRAMEGAARLAPLLQGAANLPSPPFVELLNQVSGALGWLALSEPTKPENLRDNLERQRRLIRWYVDRGHHVHACTLAREWLVSWQLVHAGVSNVFDKDQRSGAENHLGTLHAADKKGSAVRAQAEGAPRGFNLGRLWGQLTQARNELAHVIDRPEKDKDPWLAPTKLIEAIGRYIEQIEELELPKSTTTSHHTLEQP